MDYVILSGGNSTNIFASIFPLTTGTKFFGELNGQTFPSVAETNGQGSWFVSRTASAGLTLYLNGASIGTPTDASTGILPVDIFILADNNNGLTDDYTEDQIPYVFFGGGETTAQAVFDYYRFHGYLIWVGAPSGC